MKSNKAVHLTKCMNKCYDILSYPITIMNSHAGRPNSTRWQHVDMAKQDAKQDANVWCRKVV